MYLNLMTKLPRSILKAASISGLCIVACTLSTLPGSAAQIKSASINTNNRSEVVNAYQQILKPALDTPTDWSGSVLGCLVGDTSGPQKKSTLAAINFMRSMVQLNPIKENKQLSSLAKKSALIGEANQVISHYPSTRKLCFSKDGFKGSKNGNLALSPQYEGEVKNFAQTTGARGVVAFITDQGENNKVVGHRRWLLYSRLGEVGLGDTDHASTIVVVGGKLAKPVKQWIAWPSPGFFPRELEPNGRWSLSYPGADFRRARISVIGPNGLLRSKKLPSKIGYGDNTISWEVKIPANYQLGNSDFEIKVKVENVKIGTSMVSKEYKVILIKTEKIIVAETSSQSSASSPLTSKDDPLFDANKDDVIDSNTTANGETETSATQNPAATSEQTENYIRPDVNYLGLTSCQKSDQGWEITLSWELSKGKFWGRFNGQQSGLINKGGKWIIYGYNLIMSEEAPTGVQSFRTDGDFIWFMAMNGDNQVIDEYWFSDRHEADLTGMCR